jgi:hypothetical protein
MKQIKILFEFLFILLTITQGFLHEKESDQEETDLIEDFEGEEDLDKAAQNPIGDKNFHDPIINEDLHRPIILRPMILYSD